MIIGVALVVDELHKGQRLVCRYPESRPSAILNSDSRLLKFHRDYLSISPDNFAKLFRPKAALFNKVLEVTIDDICYVSYPTPCADGESADPHYPGDLITLFNVVVAVVRESSLRRVLGSNYDGSSSSDSSITNVTDLRRVGCDPLTAAMGLRDGIHPISFTAVRKVVEAFCKSLFHQEKRYKYVTKQVAIMFKVHENSPELADLLRKANESGNNSNNSSASLMSMDGSGPSSSSSLPSSSSTAASSVTFIEEGTSVTMPSNAANFNNNNSNSNSSSSVVVASNHSGGESFVASSSYTTVSPNGNITTVNTISEANILNANGLPSDANNSMSSAAGSANPALDEAVLLDSSVASTNAYAIGYHNSLTYELLVMELMLQKSSLANEIRNLYHGLIGGHSVNLTINNVISINIQLQDFSNDPDKLPTATSTSTLRKNSKSNLSTNSSNHSSTANSNSKPTTGSQTPSAEANKATATSATASGTTTDCVVMQPFQTILLVAEPDIISSIMLGTLDPSHYHSAYQHWSINTTSGIGGSNISPKTISPTMPLSGSIVVNGTTVLNSIPTGMPSSLTGSSSGPLSSYLPLAIAGNSGAVTSPSLLTDAHPLSATSGSSMTYIHPTVLQFIQIAKPTMSFLDMSNALRLPLEEIYSIAQNMCSWGIGWVINTITLSTVYQVHPQTPTSIYSQCSAIFTTVFPTEGLFNELFAKEENNYKNNNNRKQQSSTNNSTVGSNVSSTASTVGSNNNSNNSNSNNNDVVLLDRHVQCSPLLQRVLSVFDGKSSISDIVRKLPIDLQPLFIDVVVWMLRWKLLVEKKTYLVRVDCDQEEIDQYMNGLREEFQQQVQQQQTELKEQQERKQAQQQQQQQQQQQSAGKATLASNPINTSGNNLNTSLNGRRNRRNSNTKSIDSTANNSASATIATKPTSTTATAENSSSNQLQQQPQHLHPQQQVHILNKELVLTKLQSYINTSSDLSEICWRLDLDEKDILASIAIAERMNHLFICDSVEDNNENKANLDEQLYYIL